MIFLSPLLLILLSLSLQRLPACSAKPCHGVTCVGERPVEPNECRGSLQLTSIDNTVTQLNTGDFTLHTITNLEESIMIVRAETQGCGCCFTIYRGRDGRGLGHLLRQQETFDSHVRGFFKTVSSFQRIDCPQRG